MSVQQASRTDTGSDGRDAPRDALRHRPQLGELLVRRGIVTESQIEAAMQRQRETGTRLGELLVGMGAIAPVELTRTLAEHFGFEFVDLEEAPIDYLVAHLLSEPMARANRALPVSRIGDAIAVAFENPLDVLALDDVRIACGADVIQLMAEGSQLDAAITRVWAHADMQADAKVLKEAEPEDEAAAGPELLAAVEDAPVVRFVNAFLARAVSEGASDVHLEPGRRGLRVRFRIDGVLHDVALSSGALQNSVISRLKLISGLDISNRRAPQDGRTSMTVGERSVDLRVTTIPTPQGEAVVARVLDRHEGVKGLHELGFLDDEWKRYEREFTKPQGTIASTGPTGSGKSTTLHATLRELNDPGRAIVTIEDPIEYYLDGVKQMQLNVRAGVTFASALRSVLRSDPDIILVGEIRDQETARIAAEAALTGHLVLTSLHTTSAVSTPLRLVEMGLEPYLVATALSCVVGQRLARRLCRHCRVESHPSRVQLAAVGFTDEMLDQDPDMVVFKAQGCPSCNQTGFRGRIGLFEVLPVTEAIERLIVERAPSRVVRDQAVAEGMVTLRHGALVRVARGDLSIEEVIRVVPA